jgi:putative transposase
MNILNIHGKTKKNKYKSYKGQIGKIAPNLLLKDNIRLFSPSHPNQILCSDITEFKVGSDKVYLSPIIDLYDYSIVSYDISLSPNLNQVRSMLSKLFNNLSTNDTPILHTDQGWQYQMKEYQRLLREHNIIQSMSRKGNCLDNSIIENFFGKLKVEMYYGETFASTDELIKCIHEYIDYYNNERIKLKLKGLTPTQYRNKSLYLI